MKKRSLLQFHNSCMKKRFMPQAGLCACIHNRYGANSKESLNLYKFRPTMSDEMKLVEEGFGIMFWGAGAPLTVNARKRLLGYTPLRQTIVLFLAAMNNEL